MKESTQEKFPVKVNENSIFYQIKNFLIKLFNKNKIAKNSIANESVEDLPTEKAKKQNLFKTYIQNIENEETQLLKLQKQYRNGEIKEEEMTQEQVKSLCILYDKQISFLKKSNEIRKQKLLEYRNKQKSSNCN